MPTLLPDDFFRLPSPCPDRNGHRINSHCTGAGHQRDFCWLAIREMDLEEVGDTIWIIPIGEGIPSLYMIRSALLLQFLICTDLVLVLEQMYVKAEKKLS